MSESGNSSSGTEQCINCGSEIDGDGFYGQGDVKPEGLEGVADGESVPVNELFGFDDGPYCTLECSLESGTEPATDGGQCSSGINRDWPDADPTDAQDGLPDTAIVPYVRELNDLGVKTFQSCSGHVHPDGSRSDGTLWFDAEIDVGILVQSNAISHVKRMHKPENCWEIVFPGLAESEDDLDRAMTSVFHSLQSDTDRSEAGR